MSNNGKLALVINTVYKNRDLWKMFFDKLEEHCDLSVFTKKYVFVDKANEDIPEGYETLFYTSNTYRDQFSSCIDKVEEEFCLYISEDYVLYDKVDTKALTEFADVMGRRQDVLYARMHKGSVVDAMSIPFGGHKDLYIVDKTVPYFYSQIAAIWKTRDLETIHKQAPNAHIGNIDGMNSFEWKANGTALEFNTFGLYAYRGEKKRGLYHYDSAVFPYIATALVKGRWNMSEYRQELTPLIEKYGIDVSIRGEC